MTHKIFLIVLVLFGFQMTAQSGFPEISSSENIIDKYNPSDILMYYSARSGSKMNAKYFPFTKKMKKTTIKTVIINTSSDIDGAKVKLHFLSVNLDGSPGLPIAESVVFEVERDKNNTAIDVAQYGIAVPENGIFIAFEWLEIDSNKYSAQATFLDKTVTTTSKVEGKKSETIVKYMPFIGSTPSRKNTVWICDVNNNWTLSKKSKHKMLIGNYPNPYYGKYLEMAVSLILTK